MNQFDLVTPAPADPILGLTEQFRNDPRPEKVNLTVGVYQDSSGTSPVLDAVRQAEAHLAGTGMSKSYLPMNGGSDFILHSRELLLGPDNEMVATGRVASAQTPGGTGALRLAGEFLREVLSRRTIWVSNPTWANHKGIFEAADLEIRTYPYFDPETHSLNLQGLITVLEDIPENDPVLFHGCCHNPTGIDPSEDDWETIAKVCKERRLLPVVDFAYQGFASGWIDDAAAVRAFSRYGLEFLVCVSYSKNFGLYQDRVGSLHIIAKNADEASRILSRVKILIRRNYSNPPAHGSAIITTILGDSDLRMLWEEDLKAMRTRIREIRNQFVDQLSRAGVPGDFGFIRDQKGMFSFSGLSPEQVRQLREDHAVYIVDSGRINVAGLNPENLERVCKAVAAVS